MDKKQRREEIDRFLSWLTRGVERGGKQARIGRWHKDAGAPLGNHFEPMPATEVHALVEQYLAETNDNQAVQQA